MSFLARGLSNLIGIVAPVVHSFKVLKKPTKPKLIGCLHYWTIYGSLLIVDWFLTTFYISCFIPFYDMFMLTFTLLLAVPHIGFASMMYSKFLAPFLRKYERRIDKITATLVDKAWQYVPVVAMTVPAVMASMVSAFEASTQPTSSQLEIEEMDDADGHRPIILNQSFEIQEDEEEEDGDVFRPIIKREIPDEDDDFVVFPKPMIQRATMRTRRQTRSSSVM
uniref:Receptor expression-enhancing protein n=1 Tax=Caenorhabditis tropicalis TaxID=1561998 RepID=A0A1I7UGX6_9PELO